MELILAPHGTKIDVVLPPGQKLPRSQSPMYDLALRTGLTMSVGGSGSLKLLCVVKPKRGCALHHAGRLLYTVSSDRLSLAEGLIRVFLQEAFGDVTITRLEKSSRKMAVVE
jgi:hypothetical protein